MPASAASLGQIAVLAKVVTREGRVFTKRITRGSPAYTAGVQAGDELLAVDGYRVPTGGVADLLTAYEPGDVVRLLISRRGRVQQREVILGSKPAASWKLKVRKDATDAQTAHLRAWLGADLDE